MRTLLEIGLVVTLSLGIARVAGAGEEIKPEDAIKYRQSVYTVIKWNFAPIGEMVKGEIPFDADAVARHAAFIETLSQMPLEGFMPGSDKGDTQAKSEIWDDWDNFESHMVTFQEEASKLSEVAKTGDREKVKAQFGETAKACKSCHDTFRED